MTAAAELAPDQVWPGRATDALLTLKAAADTARATGRTEIDLGLLAEQTGLFPDLGHGWLVSWLAGL